VDAGAPARGTEEDDVYDDEVLLYVNGANMPLDGSCGWLALPAVDITAALAAQAGKSHRLDIMKYMGSAPPTVIGALRAGLHIVYEDGSEETLVSGSDWRVTTARQKSDWHQAPPVNFWGPQYCDDLHPRLQRQSCLFRRELVVDGKPRRARAYVTARGAYELRLNGAKVGEAMLAPEIANAYQFYQVYDLNGRLRTGTNVVGAFTGSAWYNSRGYEGTAFERNRLLARIEVELEDGRQLVVVSGSDWAVAPSALVEDDLQWGERYDARRESPGWDTPSFDAKGWARAVTAPVTSLTLDESAYASYFNCYNGDPVGPRQKRLVAQPYPPIRVIEELKPAAVRRFEDGALLYDFGQAASGRGKVRLRNTRPGQTVILRYGERLDTTGQVWSQGSYRDECHPEDTAAGGRSPFNTKNLDVYICCGAAEETYEPRFTYTAFRYLQLEGDVKPEDVAEVTHRVMHNDNEVVGHFDCDNDLVNRIWKATCWTWRSNLHAGPTDCPHREKNFWCGDFVFFGETATWFMDNWNLLAAWTTGGRKLDHSLVAWEDEWWLTPWLLYRFYGDTRPMERNYPKIREHIDYRVGRASDGVYDGMERRPPPHHRR